MWVGQLSRNRSLNFTVYKQPNSGACGPSLPGLTIHITDSPYSHFLRAGGEADLLLHGLLTICWVATALEEAAELETLM